MTLTVPTNLITELRQKTGASISKCKEALSASSNDVAAAEKWLLIQGVKPEVSLRTTGEGALAIALSDNRKCVVMVELKCETDFASKGERFRNLADNIAKTVLATPVGSVEQALDLKMAGDTTIRQVIASEISGVIKENIKLTHVNAIFRQQHPGGIGTYVHQNRKIAVMVGIKTDSAEAAEKPEFQQLLKDVAMHIAGAGSTPKYVHRSDILLADVEAQSAIYFAQIDRDEINATIDGLPRRKKPQEIREKIVAGKLNKYFNEVVLMEQPFIKDDLQSIGKLVEQVAKTINAKIEIDWFTKRVLGES